MTIVPGYDVVIAGERMRRYREARRRQRQADRLRPEVHALIEFLMRAHGEVEYAKV